MSNRTKSSLLVLVILLFYAAYQFITTGTVQLGDKTYRSPTSKSSRDIPRGGESDVRILAEMDDQKMVYTKHAKCRMDCREITKKEVEAVLKNGHINHRKSEQNNDRCPTYAVEGFTKDGQEVRIVFADCDDVTKVITTIDLRNEYKCHCK